MDLYHGSNVAVEQPRLLGSDRLLDFGPGFYLTSDFQQAARWAQLTTRRRESGSPLVSKFTVLDEKLSSLTILEFSGATQEWLDFVTMHRQGKYQNDGYDIVAGPVANDTTMPVLRRYFSGVYTAEEALKRLLPQNLTDQYAFKTQHAIELLNFIEAMQV